jgi:hypothetical protein
LTRSCDGDSEDQPQQSADNDNNIKTYETVDSRYDDENDDDNNNNNDDDDDDDDDDDSNSEDVDDDSDDSELEFRRKMTSLTPLQAVKTDEYKIQICKCDCCFICTQR